MKYIEEILAEKKHTKIYWSLHHIFVDCDILLTPGQHAHRFTNTTSSATSAVAAAHSNTAWHKIQVSEWVSMRRLKHRSCTCRFRALILSAIINKKEIEHTWEMPQSGKDWQKQNKNNQKERVRNRDIWILIKWMTNNYDNY